MFAQLFTLLAAVQLVAAAPSSPIADISLAKRATNGRATFYETGLGACGITNNNGDYIVALNGQMFGSGYPGPNCFRSITISYGGKTAQAQVTDECPSWACNYGDLDLSPSLFQYFAPSSAGVFQMTWWFNDEGGAAPEPEKTPEKEPEPSTPAWTPEPTPEPTPTPTPSPEPTPTPSSSSSSSSSESSSTSVSSSTALVSTTLNSTVSTNPALANATASLNGTAIANATLSGNNTAPLATNTFAPVAVTTEVAGDVSGNIGKLSGFVAQLGSLVVAGASL